jgi:ferredoxin-NADP reductase
MSIVKKYHSEVVDVTHHGNEVYTLEFKSLQTKYKFYPGQFLHLALDEYDPAAAWPDSRCFSMQSSPDETHIRISYAVKGNFTRRMQNLLVPGYKVWIKLPFGDLFTQNHHKQNTVFISGGTGITPYLSLFTSTHFQAYSSPHLYAGFRTQEHYLYASEIARAKAINPGLKHTFFFQDSDGIIDIARILNENKANADTSYFISGPPIMIKNFKRFLIDNGVSEKQVKTDEWE